MSETSAWKRSGSTLPDDTEISLLMKSCPRANATAMSIEKEIQARLILLRIAPAPLCLRCLTPRPDEAPNTERIRTPEMKSTAAITALVYLMAAAGAPSTVKPASSSKLAMSDVSSRSASPEVLSCDTVSPCGFLNTEMSRPSKILSSCSITERIWRGLPRCPRSSTLMPR